MKVEELVEKREGPQWGEGGKETEWVSEYDQSIWYTCMKIS
jgi:hypothetical protein